MSLQVWLPLTKNTQNYGLCGDNLITSNVTFNDGGKIGNKYLSGGTITIPASISKTFFNKSHMSFAFWLYPIGSSGTNIIMGQNPMSAGNNRMYSIFQYSTPNDLHLSWQDETATSTVFLGGVWNGFFQANVWTHCCITYNGNKAIIYRNGEQYAIANGISNRSVFEYDYPIIGNSLRKLQDVRIYDHCLSPLEVKQISQGLILHYPLNNVIGGLPRLWSLASYTRSIDLTTSYAYIYSIPNNTVWLTPGKQYTVAAEVKVNQNNILFYFDSNCSDANGVYSGNDAAQIVQYNPVVNLEKDKWVPVYITTTIKNDAGKPYYHHAFLFRTNSGTLTTNCEIRNIEVYEGNLKLRRGLLPIDTIEYDTSGYCNNGIRTGTFSWTNDTPKYQVSTKIAAASTGIKTPNFYIGDVWSMSVWFKYPSQDSSGWKALVILNNNGGDADLQFGNYINCNSNNIQYSANGKYTTGVTFTYGEWHHIVNTYDGTTLKCYLDGVYKTSLKPGQTLSRGNLGIGFRSAAVDFSSVSGSATNVQLSDVRIYATALSAQDVLSLYNNSAYIDNQGNIYGAVYEEV